MSKVLLVAICLFTNFAFGQVKEMPVLSEQEVQAKLDLVQYSAHHFYEEVWSKRERLHDSYMTHKKAKLHYSEFLHGINGSLNLEIYQPEDIKEGEKLPMVLIFPPIGGISIIDHSYAKYFARKGYIAVISQLTEDILSLPNVPAVMSGFTNTVIRNRILVDYLERQPHIDNTKMGAFGVSLGGIRSSLFYGIEDRLRGAVSIVGGGNIPGTMAHSEQKTVVKLKKRLKKVHNLASDEEYEDYLRRHYSIDPTNFAQQVHPDDFYMVIANKDKSVPTVYQRELEKRFHYPKMKDYNLNHMWTIVVMFLFKKSVGDFFDGNFMVANKIDLDEDLEIERNKENLDEVIQEIEEKY